MQSSVVKPISKLFVAKRLKTAFPRNSPCSPSSTKSTLKISYNNPLLFKKSKYASSIGLNKTFSSSTFEKISQNSVFSFPGPNMPIQMVDYNLKMDLLNHQLIMPNQSRRMISGNFDKSTQNSFLRSYQTSSSGKSKSQEGEGKYDFGSATKFEESKKVVEEFRKETLNQASKTNSSTLEASSTQTHSGSSNSQTNRISNQTSPKAPVRRPSKWKRRTLMLFMLLVGSIGGIAIMDQTFQWIEENDKKNGMNNGESTSLSWMSPENREKIKIVHQKISQLDDLLYQTIQNSTAAKDLFNYIQSIIGGPNPVQMREEQIKQQKQKQKQQQQQQQQASQETKSTFDSTFNESDLDSKTRASVVLAAQKDLLEFEQQQQAANQATSQPELNVNDTNHAVPDAVKEETIQESVSLNDSIDDKQSSSPIETPQTTLNESSDHKESVVESSESISSGSLQTEEEVGKQESKIDSSLIGNHDESSKVTLDSKIDNQVVESAKEQVLSESVIEETRLSESSKSSESSSKSDLSDSSSPASDHSSDSSSVQDILLSIPASVISTLEVENDSLRGLISSLERDLLDTESSLRLEIMALNNALSMKDEELELSLKKIEEIKKSSFESEAHRTLEILNQYQLQLKEEKESLNREFEDKVETSLRALKMRYESSLEGLRGEEMEMIQDWMDSVLNHQIHALQQSTSNDHRLRVNILEKMNQDSQHVKQSIERFKQTFDEQDALVSCSKAIILLQLRFQSAPTSPFLANFKLISDNCSKLPKLNQLINQLKSNPTFIQAATQGVQSTQQLKKDFESYATAGRKASLVPEQANAFQHTWATLKEAFISKTRIGEPQQSNIKNQPNQESKQQSDDSPLSSLTSPLASLASSNEAPTNKNWTIITKASEHLSNDQLSLCLEQLSQLEGAPRQVMFPWIHNANQTLIAQSSIHMIALETANYLYSIEMQEQQQQHDEKQH